MGNELAIKVYDVDYSFIIKNYLDPQLWEKEWTLFVYRDITFVIYLSSINTRDSSITFGVRSTHTINGQLDHDSTSFSYNIKNSNLNSLKRQIKGAMESLIETMERYSIRGTEEYKKAEEMQRQHRINTEERAENFLDQNGIYLSDVRQAYIDYYVDKMSFNYTDSILSSLSHDLLFDVYMIFYKATGQNDKFDKLKEQYSNRHGRIFNDVMNQINEKLEYMETDDYNEELDDGLDDIK